jgi:anti-sigma B factor antagonist
MRCWEPTPFHVDVRVDGGTMIVALAGEFDAAEVGRFQSSIEAALTTTNGTVVVDVADVSFIDSSALCALLRTREVLEAERRILQLRHVSSVVARLLELVGISELFSRTDTTPT